MHTAEGIKNTNALRFTTRIAALSLLITIGVSWPFYLPVTRSFALVPILSFLTLLPPAIGQAVYVLCIAGLLWLLATPEKMVPALVVLGCELFWVLQDVDRMQPYNYMYCYTILIGALYRSRPAAAEDALKLMVCGVYFWAGFHKINATFYKGIFPWFVAPLHRFSDTGSPSASDVFFFLILIITPFFEAAIGVLLLFPRWQRLATLMAFCMLATVLVCLGPLGHNWGMIVWPWNIYLFLMEFRLFYALSAAPKNLLAQLTRWSLPSAVLFCVAPVLAITTPWYALLGFKLYSGNIVTGKVMMGPQETLDTLPVEVKSAVKDHTLDIILWSMAEFKNVVYPAAYIFKIGARGLCAYLDRPKDAVLVLSFPPPFYSTQSTEERMALCQ